MSYIAIALSPFVIGISMIGLYFIRRAISRYFPEGKLKEILLMEV